MRISFQCSLSILILAGMTLAEGLHGGQESNTARDVIGRWRKAVHAHPWTASAAALIKTSSGEDGVAAEIREWITSAGNYRAVIDRAFDSTEIVVRGDSAVRRDWNGFLRKIRGRELRRLRTRVFEEEAVMFGPPPFMEDAAVSDAAGGAEDTLRVNVPGGETSTWMIDRRTGLPVLSVRPGDDTEIMTEYEAWRDAEGSLTPYRGRVSETDKPGYVWERKSVQFAGSIEGENFAPPSPGPSDTFFDSSAQPISFNFENNHIIFKVSLNGREPMLFLLDTGADEEVINQPYLASFGLEPYGKTTTTGGGGSAEYSFARGATLRVPGAEIRNQHVAIIDETGLERALGMKLGGILGFDFISRFVVEINYETSQIVLHDPATWSYAGGGWTVPVIFDGGIPFTDATISVRTKPSIPAYMVLDFGAAETMTLTSPFVKANDLLALAGTNSAVNRLTGLENQFFAQSNVRGRVDRLRLGAFAVDSFPVNLSVNTKGAYASENFSGTIGEGIYHRYHVWLDYARDRVILEPTPEASKPYPERRTYGLTLLASGADLHTYTVTGVRPSSPAEKDGFKKGDIISGLDGVGAGAFTLGDLRGRLSREGARIDVSVIRDGARVSKAIEVRLVSLDQK